MDKKLSTRRAFLTALGSGTAALAAGRAMAATDDPAIRAMIEQTQRSSFGQNFDSASRTIHMPKSSLPTLSPSTVDTTQVAVGQYEQIVARGGWPMVPPMDRLRIGNRHPTVSVLRQRLAAGGDLDLAAGGGDVFDSYVEAAMKRFQARHGMNVDGVLRREAFDALNISAPIRLAQLKLNVNRLRDLTSHLSERFVMCNIPAAQIEAVEDGVAVSRHIAVVGKTDRQSPLIDSKIVEVNFNPYWTVPASLIRKDLIPKMQKYPNYLAENKIRIFDSKGTEYQANQIDWHTDQATHFMFKQDPGALNSLGVVRINFPNNDQVYMHDTPSKNLFGDDFRFDSSGCVRVQNVRELVAWLLKDNPGWSRHEIDDVIRSGARKDVRLTQPVPVHWVYVTAWATPDGVVQFRDDIYARDGLGLVVKPPPSPEAEAEQAEDASNRKMANDAH